MISKSSMLLAGVLYCLGCSPSNQPRESIKAEFSICQEEREPFAFEQVDKEGPPAPPPVLAQELKPRATLSGHTQPVRSVTFSRDGMLLLSAVGNLVNRELKLWNLKNGQALVTFPTSRSSSLSPDGRFQAEVDTNVNPQANGSVLLWDVLMGKKQGKPRVLKGQRGEVRSLAFALDGKTLASGSMEEVKLWDTVSGRELHT
jgi:WD40 repeat protein